MTWIPFALLLIAAVLAARIAWVKEAPREYYMMRVTGADDLDHKPLVWRRVRILGTWVVVFVAFTCAVNWIWSIVSWWAVVWMVPCYIAAMWASFTTCHRWKLNTLRKMDWRYISPGNWFDRQCIRICAKEWKGVKWEKDHHNLLYNGSQEAYAYRDEIHRAGLLSYIAIALVLALSLGGAIRIIIHQTTTP